MERVKTNRKWTLMCPDECPGLSDVYGEDLKNYIQNMKMKIKEKKSKST
jgi:hypothetical protein